MVCGSIVIWCLVFRGTFLGYYVFDLVGLFEFISPWPDCVVVLWFGCFGGFDGLLVCTTCDFGFVCWILV